MGGSSVNLGDPTEEQGKQQACKAPHTSGGGSASGCCPLGAAGDTACQDAKVPSGLHPRPCHYWCMQEAATPPAIN